MTQPSRLTWIHKRNTRTGIVQPAYLVVGETDIAKSRHIAWVAIHDMKFTISISLSAGDRNSVLPITLARGRTFHA